MCSPTPGVIGLGEAAYGSVGLAVVLSLFPAHRRAPCPGAFTAGASFGRLRHRARWRPRVPFGWRWAVAAMAALGLVLLVLFRVLVTEDRLARHDQADAADGPTGPATAPCRIAVPAGSALHLPGQRPTTFVAGSSC